MNVDKLVIADIVLTIMFLIYGLVFFFLKEKAGCIISGFNQFSAEEKAGYDVACMSKDYRNRMFLTASVFFAGSVTTMFWGEIFFFITLIIGIIAAIRGIHFNSEKAYEKYRK